VKPSITTGCVIVGKAEAGVMVWTTAPVMLNLIKLVVFAGGGFAFEPVIACRSEPAPLSAAVVTVKVLAAAALTDARTISAIKPSLLSFLTMPARLLVSIYTILHKPKLKTQA
jgi:hypothetical protein